LSRTKVYITPFDVNGIYTAEIDITKWVEGIGAIAIDTDSSDYQIGVFRNSNVKLDLNNRRGLFSDISIYQSIFRYKRSDAKVRITFLESDELPYCGTAICGSAPLVEEVTVFEGLLNDESLTEEAGREIVSFIALGFESVFGRITVPFASIAVGDSVSSLLFTLLNQTDVTGLLTLDVANINPSLNQITDAVADLKNITVKAAIDKLLLLSNSILYIKNRTIYVTSRAASAALMFTFYGQASTNGAENIQNVKNITNGKNRIFNYFSWSESTAVSQSSPSVSLHGAKIKQLSSTLFTNNVKQLAIQSALVSEFRFPMQELELETPLTQEVIALNLLDKINIDYPTVYVPSEFDLPVCGLAVCADPVKATLPLGLWSLQIPSDRRYKILKRSLDFKAMKATFKMREI